MRVLLLSFLPLLSCPSVLRGQSTQSLPRGLEAVAGNASTAYPFGTSRTQLWQWVYDAGQFTSPVPILIQRLRIRPDESLSGWSSATWPNVECTLASALGHYTRTSWQPSFAANLDPADRRTIHRGDLRLSSGSHTGSGPAPWAIEIPLTTPFYFDPGAGRGLVLQLRTPGPGNPARIAIDGHSGATGALGGNRYGHLDDPSAAAWTLGNDEFVPAIEISYSPATELLVAFEASPSMGTTPLAVRFRDHSWSPRPILAWAWDFQDDGVVDSTARNPSFSYLSAGIYDVRLSVDDGAPAGPRTLLRPALITADPLPLARFTAAPRSGAAPHAVTFKDQSTSTPTRWAWDFQNDGIIDSTLRNPSFIYPGVGVYDVRLEVSNATGSDTRLQRGCIRVLGATPPPFHADFESGVLDPAFDTVDTSLPGEYLVTGALAGIAPHAGTGMLTIATAGSAGRSVHALDLHLDLTSATGSSDLELRFHGLNHNDEAHPGDRLLISDDGQSFHEILDLGTALLPAGTWREVVIDLDRELAARSLRFAAGFVIRFQQEDNAAFTADDGFAFDAIEVAETRLHAAFAASPTGGAAPLNVAFRDLSQAHSSAPIRSWSWDFQNDGIIDSTRQNPSFTYAIPGLYSVRLDVADTASASSTAVYERLIRVGGVASFPFQDGFENGLLGPSWEAWSEHPEGRVAIESSLGGPAYSGQYHVLLDRRLSGPRTTNQLTLHIDLTGVPDAELSYAFKETAEEDDPEDGCFISADGVNWHLARSHHAGVAHWSRHTVDLSAAAAAAGIAFNADFRIRFQQRDDFPVPSDGVQLDEVAVRRRSGRTLLYGTACTAPRGTPLISSSGGPPNLGNPLFALHLANSAPSSASLLIGGLSKGFWAAAGLSLPLDLALLGAPGCWLNTSPDSSLTRITDSAGWCSVGLPIPWEPALAGGWFYLQWLVIDPTVAGLPLVSTAGLATRFGMD